MQAARIAKTSDPLGRYYTDSAISTLLVEAMAGCNPQLVLDLGAGAGALTLGAATAWPAARFLTVDFDAGAASARLPLERGAAFKHLQADALADDLFARMGLAPGCVDVALCNPPYLRPRWEPHYPAILAEAGLAALGTKLREVPADLLFLAQNLRFLRNGGSLGLIIPDGIIAGERFATVRAAILQRHCVERVIELPRRVFKSTDAKAHILVLKKNAVSGAAIPVQRVEPDGTLSTAVYLTTDQAAKRMDYSFYVDTPNTAAGESLRELEAEIWRGRISSTDRNMLHYPVFHTSDFDAASTLVPARFQLSEAQAKRSVGRPAQAGDILLARIGRALERKVGVVPQGLTAVSDSVLVLRLPQAYQAGVLAFLTGEEGRQALSAIAHGVAARFITAGALASLRVPRY